VRAEASSLGSNGVHIMPIAHRYAVVDNGDDCARHVPIVPLLLITHGLAFYLFRRPAQAPGHSAKVAIPLDPTHQQEPGTCKMNSIAGTVKAPYAGVTVVPGSLRRAPVRARSMSSGGVSR
jgi:hypothetical protein